MRLRILMAFVIALPCFASSTWADGVHVVHSLNGYKCMALNLTDDEMANPKISVRLKKAPSSSAEDAGLASSPVAVSSPEDESSGFIRVMKLDGSEAWIRAIDVKPWTSPTGNPNAVCTPSLMSNGRHGFAIAVR